MTNERAISRATSYWASHLGCPAEKMFCEPLQVITHSAELADYRGVFAMFRGGAAIVSFPADCVGTLRSLLLSPLTPAAFARVFDGSGFMAIGPAYIGYAEVVPSPLHPVRSLTEQDIPAAKALRAACSEMEWEHGGSLVGQHPASGVFAGNKLVALAGYEVWGGSIAHLSVITHPEFRGHGFGRSVVAHVAGVALARGLLAQYRTLESNLASVRIAESLGFSRYATSVAVRFEPAAGQCSGRVESPA